MEVKAIIDKTTLDQKIGPLIPYEVVGNRVRRDDCDKTENLHCGGLRIIPRIHEAIPYEKRFDRNAAMEQRLAYHRRHDDSFAGARCQFEFRQSRNLYPYIFGQCRRRFYLFEGMHEGTCGRALFPPQSISRAAATAWTSVTKRQRPVS